MYKNALGVGGIACSWGFLTDIRIKTQFSMKVSFWWSISLIQVYFYFFNCRSLICSKECKTCLTSSGKIKTKQNKTKKKKKKARQKQKQVHALYIFVMMMIIQKCSLFYYYGLGIMQPFGKGFWVVQKCSKMHHEYDISLPISGSQVNYLKCHNAPSGIWFLIVFFSFFFFLP